MTGKGAVSVMLLIALAVGAGVWYAQVYAFYGDVEHADSAAIPLVGADGAQMRDLQVTDMEWVEKSSSPQGYRACFTVKNSLAMMTETYALADDAVPLYGPRWFDCFDADEIGAALEDGSALAFRGTQEIADGIDEMVVVMADGRGFAWRQLNDKYKD